MTLLANMVVPTLIPHLFWGVCALIPVILLETPFVRRHFQVSFPRALSLSAVANGFSTLVGIPLAWLLFVILSIPIVLGADHFAQGQSTIGWIWSECLMLGARYRISPQTEFLASMILVLPYYFASVFLERWAIQNWTGIIADSRPLLRTSFQMNLLSYAFLVGAFLLVYAHAQGWV
jgi:hypothetical protein